MKIVCISDTHTKHSSLLLPKGDVLIHCGDFGNEGSLKEAQLFFDWFDKQKFSYKIAIAGNHDLLFTKKVQEEVKKIQKSCIYLQDEVFSLNGVKFYGSPWQPQFPEWGFFLNEGEEMKKKWQFIPDDLDVLITHTPPYKMRDSFLDSLGVFRKNIGCKELLKKVRLIKPKYHLFGHIHYSYGRNEEGGIQFINCSSCDEYLNLVNKPIVIEL